MRAAGIGAARGLTWARRPIDEGARSDRRGCAQLRAGTSDFKPTPWSAEVRPSRPKLGIGGGRETRVAIRRDAEPRSERASALQCARRGSARCADRHGARIVVACGSTRESDDDVR
jgi:hypothetical protein